MLGKIFLIKFFHVTKPLNMQQNIHNQRREKKNKSGKHQSTEEVTSKTKLYVD